jgi:S-DNA-T family DNA segregation ATPase FtsK/SpoIIIE
VRAGDAAEIQLGFLGSEPTRAEQDAAVARLARRWAGPATDGPPTDGPGDDAPIRIRPLPTRVELDRLPVTPGGFTLGRGGDDAAVLTVDLFAGSARLLVCGPPRSGRSTTLLAIARQAATRPEFADVAVLVAAAARSPLAGDAARFGLQRLAPDDSCTPAFADGRRVLLLVDDVEVFDTPAGDRLAEWTRRAPSGLAVVASGRSDELAVAFRGVGAEVKRARVGVLLQPGPTDGEVLGVRLPRQRRNEPPGRGVLAGDPAWGDMFTTPLPVQIALP